MQKKKKKNTVISINRLQFCGWNMITNIKIFSKGSYHLSSYSEHYFTDMFCELYSSYMNCKCLLQGQDAQHTASCLQLNLILNVLALSLGSILINFSHSGFVGLYNAHRPFLISLLN